MAAPTDKDDGYGEPSVGRMVHTGRGSVPVPDPTELTSAALYREVGSLRELIEQKIDGVTDAMKQQIESVLKLIETQNAGHRDYVVAQLKVLMTRLDGIDQATTLRIEGISQIPAMVDEKVQNLADLTDERFSSVAQQFLERDIRSEREARDNKVAVDAAFAAQKEAAARQDESNAKAIDKSERATQETIKTNQELSASKTDSLTKGLDEVKLQITGLVAGQAGHAEQRQETVQGRQINYGLVGAIAAIASILLIGLTVIGFLASKGP